MIFDFYNNIGQYCDIFFISAIKDYISGYDISAFSVGDYEVIKDKIVMKIVEYDTKKPDDLFFETHDENIDLQFMLIGEEIMQVTDKSNLLKVDGPDGVEGDFNFYLPKNQVSSIKVGQGYFTVFFPGDGHRPGCMVNNQSSRVKKAVFKIK